MLECLCDGEMFDYLCIDAVKATIARRVCLLSFSLLSFQMYVYASVCVHVHACECDCMCAPTFLPA